MIDAHCHLDFEVFDDDRESLLAQARRFGIVGWICAGVSPDAWQRQEQVQSQHPDVKAAFGLHPHVASRLSSAEIDDAVELLSQRATFAIGETGLDRSRFCKPETLPVQEYAFRAQLALARSLNLPVILHILGAHGRAFEILKSDGLPAAGGMVHSYSGSAEMVRQYEELGLYLSFSASITRPNASRTLKAVQAVSSHRLLVETDCPDQAPSSRNARRNLPEWLGDVVQCVAMARDDTVDNVAQTTMQNAGCLFNVLEWQA